MFFETRLRRRRGFGGRGGRGTTQRRKSRSRHVGSRTVFRKVPGGVSCTRVGLRLSSNPNKKSYLSKGQGRGVVTLLVGPVSSVLVPGPKD